MDSEIEKMTYEQAVFELEMTVKALENGSVSLDESVKLYQRGVRLSNRCAELLADAENKVSILTQTQGNNLAEKPFSPGREVPESEVPFE
ncbi:MAG: exodeoxyribonuclease VII small subunit [Clostridiaceae bacterium]|nr:exodeoxyribonuclease VII small subunit [Clostridiaceae bacterium]